MGDYSELSPIGDGMINVYEGEYGTYHIPDNIMQKAIEMNGGKKLTDRRTKGSKYLNWWGRCQDSDAWLINYANKPGTYANKLVTA